MIWSEIRKVTLGRLAVLVLLGGSAAVLRAQPEPQVVLPPTFEGDWVKLDTVGVGTYENFEHYAAKPSLTPEGQKILDSLPKFNATSKKVGNAYVVHPHPCGFTGGGFGNIEPSSVAVHLIKSKDEILMVGEEGAAGNARHIYLDGRPLPAPGTRTPSADGYSIAHVEGDGTLVIQTNDMPQGVAFIARAVHRPETVLTQRLEPSKDGKKMKMVFTWTDPKLYAKPFTYDYTFQRLAPDSSAIEEFCDATDPLNSQTVVPPTQQ